MMVALFVEHLTLSLCHQVCSLIKTVISNHVCSLAPHSFWERISLRLALFSWHVCQCNASCPVGQIWWHCCCHRGLTLSFCSFFFLGRMLSSVLSRAAVITVRQCLTEASFFFYLRIMQACTQQNVFFHHHAPVWKAELREELQQLLTSLTCFLSGSPSCEYVFTMSLVVVQWIATGSWGFS